jgi:O-antigen/teichoic acid export membrane protein
MDAERLTPRRSTGRIFANLGSVGLLKGVADVFVFATFVFMARHFSAEGLGEYSFALALTGFVSLAGNFGFDSFAIRDVARSPARESRYFGTFSTLGLLLCPLLWGLLFVAVHALGYDAERVRIVLTIGAFQILYAYSMIVVGRFKAHENVVLPAVLESLLRVCLFGGTIATALAGFSLPNVLIAYPVAMVVFTAVPAWMLWRGEYPRLSWRVDRRFLSDSWSELWPFGTVRVLFAAYMTIDVMVIGSLRSDAEVGIYAAAQRPVFGLVVLFTTAVVAAFPTFSRLYAESSAALDRLFERIVDWLMLGFGAIAFALFWLAGPVVALIYGEAFAASALLLRGLTALLILTSLNSAAEILLLAVDRQRDRLRALGVSAALSLALNVAFVLQFGYRGAVAAVLIAEAVLLAQQFRSLHNAGFRPHLARKALRLGVGLAAATAIALWAETGASVWVGALAGTAAYLAVVGVAGGFRSVVGALRD